jgi:hypothetical protein
MSMLLHHFLGELWSLLMYFKIPSSFHDCIVLWFWLAYFSIDSIFLTISRTFVISLLPHVLHVYASSYAKVRNGNKSKTILKYKFKIKIIFFLSPILFYFSLFPTYFFMCENTWRLPSALSQLLYPKNA